MGFMGVGISARNKPTTSENFKMETIVFKILVFIAVVVAVFAKEDEENLAKMFSKEREQMREEQKEMRADFRRENTRLAREDKNLLEEVNKLHEKVDKLHDRNDEQSKEIVRLHKKLRRANLEYKRANRQRDEKESRELEGKVQDAIRKDRQSSEFNVDVESVMKKSIVRTGQNDSVETELKKLIHSEINNYLMDTKICVSGTVPIKMAGLRRTVNFGFTFPRVPSFSASLVSVTKRSGSQFVCVRVDVESVTISSATVITWKCDTSSGTAAWIACL